MENVIYKIFVTEHRKILEGENIGEFGTNVYPPNILFNKFGDYQFLPSKSSTIGILTSYITKTGGRVIGLGILK